MKQVLVSNGKAYVTDERWVTIGGEDEDGGGQHVLIKENGTIVAGFGKGKNVKNAFGGGKADTPEKANEAVATKRTNISKFDRKIPTVEELQKARRKASPKNYYKLGEAVSEKKFLTNEGEKPLKNAHFRKTSEENANFRKEMGELEKKRNRVESRYKAEKEKLDKEYRLDPAGPDSPELERDREDRYWAGRKKISAKRDKAMRPLDYKYDELHLKYGQTSNSSYQDRDDIERAARKTLKRFRNRRDSK